MANLPPSPPPESDPLSSSRLRRFWQRATRPKSIAIAGGSVVVLGGAGYAGLQVWVRTQLPPLLETQLTNLLNRPVEVGEVEGFSLSGIRLDGLRIPETDDNANFVTVEDIRVRYNFLLLLSRRLPLSLTLVEPEIYAEQAPDGTWLTLDFNLPEPEAEPGELPINPLINLRVVDGALRLLPQGKTMPFEVDLAATAQLRQKLKLARYEARVTLPQGEISLEGETHLETFESRVSTQIDGLGLAQFSPLLPEAISQSLQVESGEVNANLQVEVPSLDWWLKNGNDGEIPDSEHQSSAQLVSSQLPSSQLPPLEDLDPSRLPDIRGTLSLENFAIDLDPLAQPLTAKGFLRFQGEGLRLEEVEAKTGTLAVEVMGSADWQRGYDIEVSVPPLPLESVAGLTTLDLPELPLSGTLQANLAVMGEIDNPQATLAVRNPSALVVEQTVLQEVRANLSANLSRITLNGLRVTPAAGGRVVARGDIDIRSILQDSLDDPVSLNFDLRSELPVDALLAPYNLLPPEVSVGRLTANADVGGTWENPRLQLTWDTPDARVSQVGAVSTLGEIRFRQNRLSLETAELRAGGGSIVATGQADLDAGDWGVDVSSTPIDLSPFLPLAMDASLTELRANASGGLDNFDLDMLSAIATLGLVVEGGTVGVRADVERGNVSVVAEAADISANDIVADLPVAVALRQGRATVDSSIDSLLQAAQTQDFSGIDVTADADLAVAEGTANAGAQVRGNRVTATAAVSSISADSVVETLPVPVTLRGATARVETSVNGVLAAAETLDVSGIELVADADVAVADGTVDAWVQLSNGSIDTVAEVSSISVSSYFPEIPVPTRLLGANAQASFTAKELLEAAQTQDFTGLNPVLQADARLAVSEGLAEVVASVDGGRWDLATTAGITVTDALVTQLANAKIVTSSRFPAPLTAQANLSGSINPLLRLGTVPVPVSVDGVLVRLAEESFQTRGRLQLTELTTNPDLAADLAVDATYRSRRLPLTLLIADVFLGEILDRPNAVNIAGNVEFNGQFRGRNLISDPLAAGSLDLTGALQLQDFAINDIAFDEVMSGGVVVQTGERVAIDLQGNQDRIAASFAPCTGGNACLFPYLPTGLEIRQGEDTATPLFALGERDGDVFDLRLQNFDLALLNVVPGQPLGIEGNLDGEVTAAISADLFTLESQGTLAIDRPGVGYIRAEAVAAAFGYNNGTARLDDAFLQLGDSRFTLNAQTNVDLVGLVRGEANLEQLVQAPVDAELTVEEGKVGDLLSTVAWYQIEDIVTRGVASPSLNPEDLEADPVGVPESDLFEQLRVFNRITELVQTEAATLREPAPPRLADLGGTYDTRVTVEGTLGNPAIDVALEARDWQWRSQPAFADLSPVLGFFIEDSSIVEIDEITARASYRNEVLTVDTAQVELEGARAAFVGELSPTTASGTFDLTDLDLRTVRNFVELPLDIEGLANAQADIGGSLQKPTLEGRVSLDSPTLNGRPVDSFAGEFRYDNDLFEFATLAPSWTQLSARVPFPWTEENAVAQVRLNVDTPGFELLEALSNGQANWRSGEGAIRLAASLDLVEATSGDLDRILQALSADGEVVLEDATVRAAALPEAPAQVDGRVLISQDGVAVDNLIAKVADGTFSLSGALPFLVPQPEAENPLTLQVDNGNLKLAGLYEGLLEGFVSVSGTALTPVVTGDIALSEGRVSIPTGGVVEGAIPVSAAQWTIQEESGPPPVIPILDNFRVVLGEDFRIRNSLPQFNFRVSGDLTVNGAVDGNLDNLRPDGTISVDSGQIDLFSNLFFIAPGRSQTVTFVPERGLLDPLLDLQVSTLIYEEQRNPLLDRDRDGNEVPDTTVLPNRQSQQTLVSVSIDASAQEVLEAVLSSEAADISAVEDSQLLQTVQLTSVPDRSERELVSLLGGQVLTTIDQISKLRGTEFFEFAFLRFVVEPTLTEVLLDIDRTANRLGQTIGLDRLSVFPPGQIEAIYQLNEDSLLGLTYSYGSNGLLLQGTGGLETDSIPGFNFVELRYELRF
ncbi:translocation/assembly module TamB domain-containing protein [Baaleninema sp.]|uniref:translocation/assembly module TamB domain-containing protein n=1 Tax=Baaleninema sp. TaxID=3101197 RepID=UPI003D04D3FD